MVVALPTIENIDAIVVVALCCFHLVHPFGPAASIYIPLFASQ